MRVVIDAFSFFDNDTMPKIADFEVVSIGKHNGEDIITFAWFVDPPSGKFTADVSNTIVDYAVIFPSSPMFLGIKMDE